MIQQCARLPLDVFPQERRGKAPGFGAPANSPELDLIDAAHLGFEDDGLVFVLMDLLGGVPFFLIKPLTSGANQMRTFPSQGWFLVVEVFRI